MYAISPAIGSASPKLMSRVYFCLARRLLMTTPLRIALFIDAQNAYRRARDRFFPNPQCNVDGQFDPINLGQLIASRGGPDGLPCSLSDVRIYSGRPDPNRDKRSHEAVQPVEGKRSDRDYARPPIPANLANRPGSGKRHRCCLGH